MAQMAHDRMMRIEQRYQKALERITKDIKKIVKNETDPERVALLIDRYSKSSAFNDIIRKSVASMVTGSAVGEKSTWRAAAAESMRGA